MLPPLNKISDRLWQTRSVAAGRIAPALAARADRDAADVVALFCALVRGVGRLDSAGGKVFSPVQPGFNAGQHRRRAARHARADEQSRRLVCGTWFPWATELFNHSAWFFMSAMTAVSEFATKIPGAFFYVPAPSWLDNRNLLRRARRRLERLAVRAQTKNLERDGPDFDCRRLSLALANDARRNQIDRPAAQRRPRGFRGRRRTEKRLAGELRRRKCRELHAQTVSPRARREPRSAARADAWRLAKQRRRGIAQRTFRHRRNLHQPGAFSFQRLSRNRRGI